VRRTLVIEKLVPGGLGLARLGEGVALVRGALPGEEVVAELRRRKNHYEGAAVEVLRPSPDRVERPLPPTADLPLRYPAQLEVKAGFVEESLRRVAGLTAPIAPIAPSPRELGYRTAAQYVYLPTGGLGYRRPGGREPVGLEADPLVAEPVEAARRLLSSWPLVDVSEVAIKASLREGRALAALVGASPGRLKRAAQALVESGLAGIWWAAPDPRGRFRGRLAHLTGKAILMEDFGGVLAPVDPVSFSQVNPPAAGALYREAAILAGEGARAVELYAGVGVLSLHLAPRFHQVQAVEINARSVQLGSKNARKQGVENLSFVRDDAKNLTRFLPADLVALDPPRAGLSREMRKTLVEEGPEKLLYIACDPATWARDVGELVRAGGYRLEFARPYDFFPYTHHVEVLSLLTREGGSR